MADVDLQALIGKPMSKSTVVVERGPVSNFALAVGDKNPIYRDPRAAQEAGFAAIPAPPTWPFVMQSWGEFAEVQSGEKPKANAMGEVIGSLMAGLGVIFNPMADLEILCLIIGTSIAFNGMMFLLMVRVDDPLVPRAMFGVLNLLLFYPSGAMYPVTAFPGWLRAISIIDPFTYCVDGFKAVLLKDGGFAAIKGDLLFLFVFGIGTLLIATPLFKRTL